MAKVQSLQTKTQHLEFDFEVKALPEKSDDDFFYFEGFASTFGNIDQGRDVVVKGAFLESLSKRMPVLLWQHEHDEPIGVPIEIKETEQGLQIVGKMPKKDTLVSGRIIPQMEVGSIKAMSIGFRIKDFDIRDDVRYLVKLDLREISLVTFPMNESALVYGFKNDGEDMLNLADYSTKWNPDDAVKRVTEFCSKNDLQLSDCFFAKNNMPFVDVIDGELKAVPVAVEMANNALYHNDSLEAEEKANALIMISEYRRKIATEFPMKSIDEIDTIKDANRFLIDMAGGKLSHKQANLLINKIKAANYQDGLDIVSKKLDDLISKLKPAS